MKNPLGIKNFGLTVYVGDDNIEKALRKLKKKINNDGKLQLVRARQEFVKPTTKRKLAKGAAKARWRKKLQAESMPKRKY